MRDDLTAIEAGIRHIQCLLQEMLWSAQILDMHLGEMAETEDRPLSHTDGEDGAVPSSATGDENENI